MSLGFAIFYFYGMRKAVARVIDGRNARETHQLSRYVFGPRTNWTTMLMQVLVMSVFAFVFLLFISVITGDRSDFWNGFGHGFGWAFAGMFLLMQPILYLVQIFYALYKTRREQALVSLTPGVGLHLELHDVLISYIWRQFLILYALSFVLTLAFVFSFDKFDLKASALVLLLAFMFPCSLALTVNFGRMKNQNDHSLLKWLAFAIGGFIISISSLMFVPFEMSWGIFGVMMVGTLLLRQKRSKGQLKSTNFPVGRAAN